MPNIEVNGTSLYYEDTGPGSTGECPCTATPTDGSNVCTDQTADYFLRVRRVAAAPLACVGYVIELSNGVY